MDEKDPTCYIIGDTIILPFDLNDDDVLNVENVPSNIGAINHRNQQPECERDATDKSSRISLKQPTLLSDGPSPNNAKESNELALVNRNPSKEPTGFELGSQLREEDVFEFSRQSTESNILKLASQQAESIELEFKAQTVFAKDCCKRSRRPYGSQVITIDDSETKTMKSYREGDEDEMANYDENITNNSHPPQNPIHFPHSLDTFTADSHPCISANPTSLPVNADSSTSINNDNSVLISSNYESENERTTGMRLQHESFWHKNVENEDDGDSNSLVRPLKDIQSNHSFLLTTPFEQPESLLRSQNVDTFILPDVNIDTINFTSTSWGDEHIGANYSGQNGSHGNTRNNYGTEYFVNENAYVNSSTPCDIKGHPVSNERPPNPYSANTAINCARNEDNRWYLQPGNGAIPGNGHDRLSMNNIIELPVYPHTFVQQHQMPGIFHQFDARYSSVLQPGGDNVHPNVNSFQQAQAFQPYMEQVYPTNDNFNTHFNQPPNFVMNRTIMYESQPTTSSFSQRLQNDDDSTCPYLFPQFNGSNAFTAEVKVPQLQGYFQPEDMACLESPTKGSTNNQPADAFIEKILQTVHGEELSTDPAYQSSSQEQVADDCVQSLDVTDDVKLQKVLSMERALRCEIQGNSILPPKAWASKYQSSSGSKQVEPIQELDPKTKAEMKREEVANAAKAIFMKRTGTLFHWIHPGESKSELKTRVEQAWSRLSEKESNYYFSQVLGRCNSDFQTRPMVNPRLMELLNPGDYQELAGILNNDSAGDMLLPEPMEDTKRPKQNNFKQRRQRERQRPDKVLNRNSKITRGHEARQAYSSLHSLKDTESFCDTTNQEGISSKYHGSLITDDHLSYQPESSLLNQSNENDFMPFIDNGLPDLDHAVYSSDRASGTHLLSSSGNYEFVNSGSKEGGMLSNQVMHSFENNNSSGRQKATVKNRGPRGPYKKKGRRSKNTTDSDDDWELNPTIAHRGASMSGKEKPSFSHSTPGENDSENSYEASRYRRNFETDGNSLDSDGVNTLHQQDRQYSLSESLTRISSSGIHKKKGSRGPRGPYKKRKQESGRGRGRGRGRPPKRRKISSEEDDSSDESSSRTREDPFSSPRNPDSSRLDWSGRQSEGDALNDDDSFDPCVSRQCESFSGKVKPSLQLQEELRNSVFPDDTNSEANSAEERNSNDQWSTQQEQQPRCSYGSSLSQDIYTGKRICERKGKSKSPARAKARTKASEAFLVESEAMQMQFYQEVSSEDDNKTECAPIQSLPLTSADMAVKSLRRLHGSANNSAQASSGTDNSDADWSPRQLRCMSGKTSSRRGFRTTRTTKQGNSQTPSARSVARKGSSVRF